MRTKTTIPTGWNLTKLGKAAEIVLSNVDKHIKPDEKSVFLCNYMDVYYKNKITSSKGLSNGTVKPSEYKKFKLRKGDVLITKDSETPEDIAKSCVVEKDFDDIVCGYHIAIVKGNNKKVDGFFLKRIFDVPVIQHYFFSLSNGVTRFGLTKPSIEKAELLLPPLPEQEKIVEVLESWDDYLEKLTQVIKFKKKVKKGLMQKLLTGKAYLSKNISKQNKSRYFISPQHWEIVSIAKIAQEVSKKNNNDSKLPVLSCTKHFGLVDSLKFFKKQIFSKKLHTYRIVKRDQFAYATNHIEEGSIGLQNLYDAGLVSPMYTVFKTDRTKILNNYLYPLLKTELYRHIFEAKTSSSVNRRGSLRWKSFSKIKIPLPPMEEQKAIANILTTADQEIEALENKKNLIEQQKKFLLNNLITGRIRLPEFIK